MNIIKIGCSLRYSVRQPTIFLFKVAASWTPHQSITDEVLTITPQQDVESWAIGEGSNRLHRIQASAGQLSLNYVATAEMTPEIERPRHVDEAMVGQMPAEVLTYMNPSRYCESDLLARFAYEEFGGLQRGYSRVQAICDWVYQHLDYAPGSTSATTTAADVLVQRTGVCRDYAHLAITLCRGIGIPARYVSGYAVNLQPPDFHGFFEAFLDGQWYLFDPTRLASTLGLVRIGVGRDAADVAFATLTGASSLTNKQVWANHDGPSPTAPASPAVSIA